MRHWKSFPAGAVGARNLISGRMALVQFKRSAVCLPQKGPAAAHRGAVLLSAALGMLLACPGCCAPSRHPLAPRPSRRPSPPAHRRLPRAHPVPTQLNERAFCGADSLPCFYSLLLCIIRALSSQQLPVRWLANSNCDLNISCQVHLAVLAG